MAQAAGEEEEGVAGEAAPACAGEEVIESGFGISGFNFFFTTEE